MLKLIAILVFAGNVQVAVEQPSGYAEASFKNSPSGAQSVIEFAETSIGDAPDGARIVVGWVDDSDNPDHTLDALAELEIKHGIVGASDIQAAVSEHNLPEPSARAVALADEKRFGFLYRRKK